MADALSSERYLLGSTTTGWTYGRSFRSKKMGLLTALFMLTLLIAGVIIIIYLSSNRTESSAPTPSSASFLLHIPHISLINIHRISTFRSAIGGSWPGTFSTFNHNATCASLKHWFEPFSDLDFTKVFVYSPLNGTITSISLSQGTDDSYGYDILIQGSPEEGDAQYLIQIGHVNITDHENIIKYKYVHQTQVLGHHIGNFVNSDISILNQSAYNEDGEYVSMFRAIDSKTLKEFQKHNMSHRAYAIITDPQRKEYPLNCTNNNEIVNNTNWSKIANWVYLNTTSPAVK